MLSWAFKSIDYGINYWIRPLKKRPQNIFFEIERIWCWFSHRGIYFHKKLKLFQNAEKIFKTFPKFRIFFLWIFSPKVFQDCFLSYCIKSCPKLRKKFPQISRIYQNFFYQTSKLFQKNTEIRNPNKWKYSPLCSCDWDLELACFGFY